MFERSRVQMEEGYPKIPDGNDGFYDDEYDSLDNDNKSTMILDVERRQLVFCNKKHNLKSGK